MKFLSACTILVLLISIASPAEALTLQKHKQDLTPVSRTVELLQGLAKTAEEDGKKEETLFNKFVCWGKSVISSKTASNKDATSKIQELETYIADIEAGRIEFTSERADLEKDLEELNAGIETATTMREEEHAQFLEAEKELVQATDALDAAIAVLKKATEGHTDGVLLTQQHGSNNLESVARRTEEYELFQRAAELGSRVLTKGDARFLQRLLTGDVPEVDWKKLNRKATFKMGYKGRSFKIQAVLADLKQTFSANLDEARSKEKESSDTFEKLMSAKGLEKTSSEEALAKLTVENGARSLTKEQAGAEVDALKTQVANDEKFIVQTSISLQEKIEQWEERSTLRAGEISAISKAISILSNDDAKDLFKKSFTSQGYSLMQTSKADSDHRKSFLTAAVSNIVSAAGRSGGSGRLFALAASMRSVNSTHFTEVLDAIGSMVKTLKDEEADDLARKEQCEKDMADDTRKSAVKSRTMDELTDGVTTLKSEIEGTEKSIAALEETIKETDASLKEATTQREDERTEFEASDADDQEAVATVKKAKDVLEKFYADNNLMLVQQPSAAGEAPPPPPSTWDAPYGGKTGESTSIIAVLDMIISDIDKDIATAKAAESKAQTEYDAFKKESETSIEEMQSEISNLNGAKADKEESVAQKTGERTDISGELAVVLKKIADAKPECDFISVNFEARKKNRQIEMDGLVKATAILKGAAFSKGPDPTREMRPGDALLLQRTPPAAWAA